MEVILLKDIDNVGEKHSIVKVKDGFGRNFLIPKALAVIANGTNLKKLDKIKAEEAAREAATLTEYQDIADKINGQTIKVGVKSGTSKKIFGSVTNIQIANALKEQLEVEVDRKKIALPEEIKTLGTYTAVITLHDEVDCSVDFELISE